MSNSTKLFSHSSYSEDFFASLLSTASSELSTSNRSSLQSDKANVSVFFDFRTASDLKNNSFNTNKIQHEADFGRVPVIEKSKMEIIVDERPINGIESNSLAPDVLYSRCTLVIDNQNAFPISCCILSTLRSLRNFSPILEEQFIINDLYGTTVQISPDSNGNTAPHFPVPPGKTHLFFSCNRVLANNVGLNVDFLLFYFHFPLICNTDFIFHHQSCVIGRRVLAANYNQTNLSLLLSVESRPFFPPNYKALLDSTDASSIYVNNAIPSLRPLLPVNSTIRTFSNLCLGSVNENTSFATAHLISLKKAIVFEQKILAKMVKEFDLFDLELKIIHKSSERKNAVITVPGVAEGKPSLWIGDAIQLWIIHTIPIRLICYITSIKNDQIIINFPYRQLIHCTQKRTSNFIVHVRFSHHFHSFKRSSIALEHVKNNIDDYKHILFPSIQHKIHSHDAKEHEFSEAASIDYFNPNLNAEQKLVVSKVIHQIGNKNCPMLIIFGPHGTGKTTNLVECILQTLKATENCRVLICTPSDYSADFIAERLIQSSKFTPASLFRLNPYYRHTSLISGLAPFCSIDLQNGMYSIPPLAVLKRFSVIVTSCVNSADLYEMGLDKDWFHSIFFDEAAQSSEAEMCIPLVFASTSTKVICSGDHKQFAPTVFSSEAKRLQLGVSLQERLMRIPLYSTSVPPCVLLTRNYRAHPAFLDLTSSLFYNSQLIACANKTDVSSLTSFSLLPNKNDFPLLFYGCLGKDVILPEQSSYYNVDEASFLLNCVESLLNSNLEVKMEDIVVLTPYRLQVLKIRQLFRKKQLGTISVDDVYSMQGKEKKIVMISTVRSRSMSGSLEPGSNTESDVLTNEKLFNVAVSRAKSLTIIVGNPYSLQQYSHWKKLILYCIKNKAYTGCPVPIQIQQEL